jgi:hypothetical protein
MRKRIAHCFLPGHVYKHREWRDIAIKVYYVHPDEAVTVIEGDILNMNYSKISGDSPISTNVFESFTIPNHEFEMWIDCGMEEE